MRTPVRLSASPRVRPLLAAIALSAIPASLAAQEPARVKEMAAQYEAWAERCGVIPREKIVALMSSQGVTRAFWEKDEV